MASKVEWQAALQDLVSRGLGISTAHEDSRIWVRTLMPTWARDGRTER